MKIIFSIFLGYLSLTLQAHAKSQTAKPLPPSNQHAISDSATSPPQNSKEYDFASELLKQILLSVEKDKFDLNLNLDMSFANDGSAPVDYKVLNIDAAMLFKNKTNEINISIFPPKENPTDEEKKLNFNFSLNLSNKLLTLSLKKTEKPGEFIGEFQFFEITKNFQIHPSSIYLKISNELLDIKELKLFGANLKLKLTPHKDQDLREQVLKIVLECNAENQATDLITGEVTMTPLEKCVFSFDGDKLRVQYKDGHRILH